MPQRDKKKRGPKLSDCFVMCVCVVFNQILSDHLLESIRQMWTEIHLQIHLIVPLCSTIKCKLDHRRTERRTQTWQWDNCLTGANENCGKKRKKTLSQNSNHFNTWKMLHDEIAYTAGGTVIEPSGHLCWGHCISERGNICDMPSFSTPLITAGLTQHFAVEVI